MDESIELKPCPFCGGPGYLCQIPSAAKGDRYIWVAKCSVEDGCGVEFLGCSRKVDAIKEWNTRILESDNERLTRRVAVLEGGLWAVRLSFALEEIGTPVCNCGGKADEVADELDKIRAESKRIAEEV